MNLRVFDRPAASLSQDDCQTLDHRLRVLAAGYLTGVSPTRRFTTSQAVIVAEQDDGTAIGFLCVEVLPPTQNSAHETLYLNIGVISTALRPVTGISGLLRAYLDHNDNHRRFQHICLRTQSPVVHRTYMPRYGMHPRPDAEPSAELRALAADLAGIVYREFSHFQSSNGFVFDRDKFVHRRALGDRDPVTGVETGKNLYPGTRPWCRHTDTDPLDRWVNAFHRDHLDPDNGDAVFLVGTFGQSGAVIGSGAGEDLGAGAPVRP